MRAIFTLIFCLKQNEILRNLGLKKLTMLVLFNIFNNLVVGHIFKFF